MITRTALAALCLFLHARTSPAQWVRVDTSFIGGGSFSVFAFAKMDSTLFAATNGYGIYRSSNDGRNWIATGTNGMGSYEGPYYGVAILGDELIAGTYNGANVYRSIDYGAHWIPTTKMGLLYNGIYSLTTVGSDLYASSRYGTVALTRDTGKTWTDVSINIFSGIRKLVYSAPYLYACTDTDGLFRTSNKGLDWEFCGKGIPKQVLSLIEFGSCIFASSSHGVYRSTDKGNTWEISDQSLSQDHISSLASCGPVLFAISEYDNGLLFSVDSGRSWKVWEGRSPWYMISMAVLGKNLYVGTDGSGVWRRPLSELPVGGSSGIAAGTSAKHILQLVQVLLNSSCSVAQVLYDIPERSEVTLKVYDCTGREIRTLVNQVLDAGEYEHSINCEGLASGEYYCLLRSNNEEIVRPVLLLR